jgi:hypothetical protein
MSEARNWSIIEEVYEEALPDRHEILLVRCASSPAMPTIKKSPTRLQDDKKVAYP